jgi:transcriptional regulator with XRE-family HTH domain
MQSGVDKRSRAATFRERLADAMGRQGLNRSALARATGVDRSTISQLLSGEEPRLPNALLAADCGQALGVSVDWLLGLTERPERPGDLIAAAVTVARAERTYADEQLLAWMKEAEGYKIRTVPATLPDMLKTEAVLRWEYEAFLGRTPDQAIGAERDRVTFLRAASSDYEIAVARHELEAFAAGEGYYRGLPRGTRIEALARLETECDALYPSLRLFLYDARRVFSAPITVFGPLVAVVYVGRFHLAFRESNRVKSLAQHFDWLVREAAVDARDAPAFVRGLREALERS